MSSAVGSAAAVAATALILLLGSSLVQAEVSQRGTLRVDFGGEIRPKLLPRHATAPIAVSLSGDITTTDRAAPPPLRTISVALNRHGRLDNRGLPTCPITAIQPATSEVALDNCRRALIGDGRFRADVALPDQSPFPSDGRLLAFNGRDAGRTVIFAHIYGTKPLPISYVLPFVVKRQRGGGYPTRLVAQLPRIAADWGSVSGISLTLRRNYKYRGEQRSYLAAGCPAPKGVPAIVFSFARASFLFAGGKRVSTTLSRSCRPRR